MRQPSSPLVLLLCLFTGLLPLSCMAQPIYNVKAGLHGAAFEDRVGDEAVEARAGWYAGMDLRIGGGALYLQPGAFLHHTPLRLHRVEQGGSPSLLEGRSRIYSLRMPLLLGWRMSQDPLLAAWHLRAGLEARWQIDLREEAGFALSDEQLREWIGAARIELGVDILFLTLDVGYHLPFTGTFTGTDDLNHGLLLAIGASF